MQKTCSYLARKRKKEREIVAREAIRRPCRGACLVFIITSLPLDSRSLSVEYFLRSRPALCRTGAAPFAEVRLAWPEALRLVSFREKSMLKYLSHCFSVRDARLWMIALDTGSSTAVSVTAA